MAATRLIALHKNKDKSVAACLKSRTDYAKNPDKTNRGELVSSLPASATAKSSSIDVGYIENASTQSS